MWWVPLTYTTQDDPNFLATHPNTWMADTDKQVTVSSLPASDKWVIFNVQETGYYKVNYDDNNWQLLIAQLGTDHTPIHVLNRAQLIDDALDLARARTYIHTYIGATGVQTCGLVNVITLLYTCV